ncbi:MAG: DNA helicase UvrD, partial [Candidatus Aenigmarchaeota archaeon]|nr:DNA helicase UvrD [Candidatus Aenigmarchaeota archaeon]
MRTIADLHIHSHYSRATSKRMNLEELSKYAKIKGVDLLGTGDFTHPEWFSELKSRLKETAHGIYEYNGMRFLFSTEISLIYTQGGRGRKVHNVILAPDMDGAKNITDWIKTKGRVDYDGRPIFGFSCIELVEAMRKIDEKIEVIPAHIWTPHFGAMGAASGFDSVKECFGDQARHIHALETGLSSDPAMNWRVSSLDKYALVSFSDSHSAWPWRLGREATVFDLKELTYDNIIRAIRTREGLAETLEFFPEEGKYHLDGHRACNVCMEPKESIRTGKICPVCKRPLTIGVLHRVEELADREEGFQPEGAKPFRSLIPLSEIIASVKGTSLVASKNVWSEYNRMLEAFGSEYRILLEAGQAEMAR